MTRQDCTAATPGQHLALFDNYYQYHKVDDTHESLRSEESGVTMQASSTDPYAATAAAYDLFAMAAQPEQIAALECLIPHIAPDSGIILDVGAGSGLATMHLLKQLPEAHVLAL